VIAFAAGAEARDLGVGDVCIGEPATCAGLIGLFPDRVCVLDRRLLAAGERRDGRPHLPVHAGVTENYTRAHIAAETEVAEVSGVGMGHDLSGDSARRLVFTALVNKHGHARCATGALSASLALRGPDEQRRDLAGCPQSPTLGSGGFPTNAMMVGRPVFIEPVHSKRERWMT
jgi:hypothetical protein